jgi:hypothetical protein
MERRAGAAGLTKLAAFGAVKHHLRYDSGMRGNLMPSLVLSVTGGARLRSLGLTL